VISIANGEFIGYRRKNSQPSVLAVFISSKFSKAEAGEKAICTSIIAAAELRFGAEKSGSVKLVA